MFDESAESLQCCETKAIPTTIKQMLENRLAKVNAGLEVLDKNPELANTLETIQRAIRA